MGCMNRGALLAPYGRFREACASRRLDLPGLCKAHYVIADARSYTCSGHWNGGACSNHIRVRRDAIERIILGGVRRDFLAPERVDRMAREMRAA
jgi:hypothetical protein